jgi:hypothetical protein
MSKPIDKKGVSLADIRKCKYCPPKKKMHAVRIACHQLFSKAYSSFAAAAAGLILFQQFTLLLLRLPKTLSALVRTTE